MSQVVAQANAGDFHFELRKEDDGKFHCLRSDVSAPMHPEEVKDLREIPQQVFTIFNGLMY
ncbi:MAG TPA: hypothetical protein VIY48_14880 [Candidatus Paceibacterota bacterium]